MMDEDVVKKQMDEITKLADLRLIRIAELESAIRHLARGYKSCASGTQRISRDEMKDIARAYCTKYNISWS